MNARAVRKELVTTRITTAKGIDVTEGVQAAYDLVLNSMDWGSGFLSIEDIEPLLRLACAAGYDTDPIAEYIADSTTKPDDWWEVGAEDRKQRRQEWLESARAKIEALRQEMEVKAGRASLTIKIWNGPSLWLHADQVTTEEACQFLEAHLPLTTTQANTSSA